VKRLAVPGLLVAGLVLGIAAYRVQVHNLPLPHEHGHALASVAVAWSFLIAGLVAWRRRPGNSLGPLMIAAGFALLARQLRYSHDALLFTVFFALGDLSFALVAHSTLAYPSGRLRGRAERALVKSGYATALVFPLAVLLFHAAKRPLLFFDPLPRRSLLLLADSAHAAELLQRTQVVVFDGVLATLFIAVIARRLVRATTRTRRLLAPLLLAAVALALHALFQCVFTFVNQTFAYNTLFWWQIVTAIALPIALLVGMLRARLARATVGALLLELERTPPQGLRDALARALADPSLEVAYWLPERGGFVDSAGTALELPADAAQRAVTRLEHEGEPVAALIHDPSLLEEPNLVEAVGAAARLALENRRLQAETRAQLQQVQESRVRIVTAADEERRRIERNLHDGAQQRLVALALQLRSAQRQLGDRADPEVDRILAATVDQLQDAVEELRALARGVHPAILTEEGLAAALESLTSRTPLPVSLQVADERLPPQVEATAYFVASEALTNIIKHAHASKATISAHRRSGVFVIAVEDNGIGGAHPCSGSGLQGLADRVEALGGRLTIKSAPSDGTRIVGEIPCAS
jgi:signal transduction histidine kinase